MMAVANDEFPGNKGKESRQRPLSVFFSVFRDKFLGESLALCII